MRSSSRLIFPLISPSADGLTKLADCFAPSLGLFRMRRVCSPVHRRGRLRLLHRRYFRLLKLSHSLLGQRPSYFSHVRMFAGSPMWCLFCTIVATSTYSCSPIFCWELSSTAQCAPPHRVGYSSGAATHLIARFPLHRDSRCLLRTASAILRAQ